MKKIRIRALSLIALFALFVTMLPTGFAVSAAYEAKIQIENANELGIKKDLIIGNGYRINKADYWTMIHTADSMKAVYCLEAGAHVSSGDSYTEDSANKYHESLATAELDADDIRNLIGRVFLYAFTGELTSVEAYYKYTATQLLVWEALVGQRDINFNRVDNGYTSVEKLLDMVPSKYNGLTLCTGSLGASPKNDMVEIIKAAGDRIYFAHLRNVSINDRWFNETEHESDYGSLDMYEIVKALQEVGFDGYIRPDHGRMIWGEVARPGYGLYDRALGVSYLNGLWEAVEKSRKEK